MASDIDFYFDFSSPYGYFAATRIDALAAKYGRKVKWHPVLLGVVFKKSGAAPLTLVPLKGEYSRHDFARSARFHGIPFNMPSVFPIASQNAARVMLRLQNQGKEDQAIAIAFAKAVYHAFFVDGQDVSDLVTLQAVMAAQELDVTATTEAINEPAIKEQLKKEVEQAIERGVFGSPYMIVDDEPFWGFDRFDQLEVLLKNGRI
jgi:2-hydroxychromene-2-carboxylate isomerase